METNLDKLYIIYALHGETAIILGGSDVGM